MNNRSVADWWETVFGCVERMLLAILIGAGMVLGRCCGAGRILLEIARRGAATRPVRLLLLFVRERIMLMVVTD